MTSTAQSTLPRTMSPALFQKTSALDVSRMAGTASSASRVAPSTPVIGQRMPDGSVYAGISPDNGRPMYTTPKDTGLCGTWNEAMDYASKARDLGRNDWRVPTKAELNQLFTNRAAIGNFDETGHIDRGWYWSSSQDSNVNAWVQRFRDGHRGSNYEYFAASLRCVRG